MQVFFAQLTSLIGEGTFERFPGLRVALLEGGFTWLPSLMWRLDKEWKGLRRDIPWVRRPPSETIRERVRLSVQPLEPYTHPTYPAFLLTSPDVLRAKLKWGER